jgi:hypothetical protein
MIAVIGTSGTLDSIYNDDTRHITSCCCIAYPCDPFEIFPLFIDRFNIDDWALHRAHIEHIIHTILAILFNIFNYGFYRRMLFSKSGFLARADKRKFH